MAYISNNGIKHNVKIIDNCLTDVEKHIIIINVTDQKSVFRLENLPKV